MKGIIAALTFGASPALACDVALMLAVDISGSVDAEEYRIQMDGLAAGLLDGVVTEALITAKAQVAVMQWTGATRQTVVVNWTSVDTAADVEALASEIVTMPRMWPDFSTAIGEAMALAAIYFEIVPECERLVMDISGDGRSNEGREPYDLWVTMAEQGIIVNALAIEESSPGLTRYFETDVITGPGAFAVTANTFADYPDQIRRKLYRELTDPLALAIP